MIIKDFKLFESSYLDNSILMKRIGTYLWNYKILIKQN